MSANGMVRPCSRPTTKCSVKRIRPHHSACVEQALSLNTHGLQSLPHERGTIISALPNRANRSSSRPPPPTCSRSSVARPSTSTSAATLDGRFFVPCSACRCCARRLAFPHCRAPRCGRSPISMNTLLASPSEPPPFRRALAVAEGGSFRPATEEGAPQTKITVFAAELSEFRGSEPVWVTQGIQILRTAKVMFSCPYCATRAQDRECNRVMILKNDSP
jgi:hypothetical protein